VHKTVQTLPGVVDPDGKCFHVRPPFFGKISAAFPPEYPVRSDYIISGGRAQERAADKNSAFHLPENGV
jgi:hypothetical protein